MKTLIVYDSVFGNTEQVAKKIGESIGATVLKVSQVQPEQLTGLELLIVGSPTRAFKPTKDITNFLNRIPNNRLKGVKVTAFDTRMSLTDVNSRILTTFVKIFGYADKPIAEKLVKKGGILAVPSAGFIVKASEGPMKDGELDRAASWAKSIVKTS